MRLHKIIIPFVIILCQCSPRQDKEEETNNDSLSVATEADTVALLSSTRSVAMYKRALEALPLEESSSLIGLTLFRKSFQTTNRTENDKALQAYLQFQARLIESLNERLHESEYYEAINSLVWADTSRYEKKGKDYRDKLKGTGLVLAFTEGTPYIDRDAAVIRNYFHEYLTGETQSFYSQFEEETKESFSEDGGLIISLESLAGRIGFWDTFLSKYPNSIFVNEAKSRLDVYLFYFVSGMDNTPAFDYEGKLEEEFKAAYDFYVQTYPSTSSAGIISEYLSILNASEYKRNAQVDEFIKKIGNDQGAN
jgi:hypothetical protein